MGRRAEEASGTARFLTDDPNKAFDEMSDEIFEKVMTGPKGEALRRAVEAERMKKPRVGVDVDGVLADLLTPCFRVAAEMFGKQFTINHLTSWDLDSIIPKDRLDEFWKKIGEPGICRNLVPYPGAVEGMKLLAEVADVYLVTSHLHDAPQWVHERDEWAFEHFAIKRSKMVHTKAKYTFNAKMLIDDKPQTIAEWAEEYPHSIPVLWNQPYNEMYKFPEEVSYRVMRTNSWDEIVKILKQIQGVVA